MNAFTPDAILMVAPQDADDPAALAQAGQRCQFVRYVDVASGSRYAAVRFSTKGRLVYFRSGDLVLAEQPVEAKQS